VTSESIRDAEQIRAAGEAASDVELVFSNAGVVLASGIAESTVLDQARREMEVNYFGPLRLLQRLAPTLARNGGGAIVNIGSLAGLTNLPIAPTYSSVLSCQLLGIRFAASDQRRAALPEFQRWQLDLSSWSAHWMAIGIQSTITLALVSSRIRWRPRK
jgi:NAD(P)-dependent dehydrogenase (short-subunit alcohol dehydrogenase family)